MSAKTLYKVKSLELVLQIMASSNKKDKKDLKTDENSYKKFSAGWRKINLDEFIAKFNISDDYYNMSYSMRKISFWDDDKKFEIVCAASAPYFRIQRQEYIDSSGKLVDKAYVGLDLKEPYIPGNIRGNARRSEILRLTHFAMTCGKGTI